MLGRRVAFAVVRHMSSTAPRHTATIEPPIICVVSSIDHPALKGLPRSVATFVVTSCSDAGSMDQRVRLAEGMVINTLAGQDAVRTAGELLTKGLLPKLRWVHCFTAGVDALVNSGFMSGPLAQHGLRDKLTNGRGAFSSSLAEYALAAALHFNKQIPRCLENRAARRWDKFEMDVLRGKTLGLLGYGDIAKATARLAKAFGMRVVALRRNVGKPHDKDLLDMVVGPDAGPVLHEHKNALLEHSDVVVSTLPGTAEARHFMSAKEFAAMKNGAIFISVGRGTAVDEAALVAALPRLGGAALDVFETEPLPNTSALWDVSDAKFLLTAHNADYTSDYFDSGWGVWKENCDAFVHGTPFVTPVDTEAGY